MFIIKNSFDKRDIRDINNIYVREVYENNRIYEEYYKIVHKITVLSGYVIYKEVGETVICRKITNLYRPKPFFRRTETYNDLAKINM